MEKSAPKKLRKIQLIEEPKSEDLLRKELEEALGGWSCGTYDDGWIKDSCSGGYSSGSCSGGNDYCGTYTW